MRSWKLWHWNLGSLCHTEKVPQKYDQLLVFWRANRVKAKKMLKHMFKSKHNLSHMLSVRSKSFPVSEPQRINLAIFKFGGISGSQPPTFCWSSVLWTSQRPQGLSRGVGNPLSKGDVLIFYWVSLCSHQRRSCLWFSPQGITASPRGNRKGWTWTSKWEISALWWWQRRQQCPYRQRWLWPKAPHPRNETEA